MRLGSYAVEDVDLTIVGGAASTVNVGDTDVLLGEFRLDNATSERDVTFRNITLRNDGTADAAASLSNLALYSDGQQVSSAVEMIGRDVSFTLSSVIENGRSENFEIRADATGAERNPETYEFRVRNTTDVTVTEVGTGFSAPITLPAAPWNLGTVTVEGGDLLLSRDTSFTTTQTVSPSTSDVVLWAGRLNVNEAVEFEDIQVDMTLGGLANMDQISSLRFVVGNQTVASITPSADAGTPTIATIDMDAQFTVSANTTVRLVANLRSNAEGTFNNTAVTLGSSDIRYLNNDEVATLNGGAAGINTTVTDATLSITQNDGIDNINIVSGAQDVTVLGFALRASDVSDVRVTSINPTVTGSVSMNNVSNVRLYQGSDLIATRNNYDFNSLNITIPKNTSVSFTIVADFNTSVAAFEDHTVTIDPTTTSTNLVARDVSSNTDIVASNSASNAFVAVGVGELDVTVNSSTPLATIVTPSTSEAAAFRFDVEANNDRARITDIYITSAGTINLAQALKSSKLTLAGTTTSGVILDANTLHFPLGSNGVILERDEKSTAELRVAFFDSRIRTNESFQFALATGAPTGSVNGTLNGMRVLSESTGDSIDRGATAIAGNTHLLARSKPTVAATTFTASTNELYRFSVTADSNRKITLEDISASLNYTGAGDLNNAQISIYRDNESSGNLVFTNKTLTDATPTPNVAAVAQSITQTMDRTVVTGDTLSITINGNAYTQAFAGDA